MRVPEAVSKKMKRNENMQDRAVKALEDARQYYKATLILDEAQEGKEFFPPVLMNAAFACELFCKAMLYKLNDEEVRGHNLKELYDNLPDKVKLQIDKKMTGSRFEKSLTDCGELFEVCRYRYEFEIRSMHYGFMLDYMKTLFSVSDFVSDIDSSEG